MDKMEKSMKNDELINKQEEKTATDNQWISVTQADGCTENTQKTATNNQWTSTNKNVK